MHRDLKLENLLLAAPNDISCVKIAGALPFLLNLQRANEFQCHLTFAGHSAAVECVSSEVALTWQHSLKVLSTVLLPCKSHVLV